LGQNQRFDYPATTVSPMRARLAAAHARCVAAARTAQHGDLAVEIPCRECGRPIRMIAVDGASELADRAEFLRVHRDCLVASIPEQPTAGFSP